ncbi:hypothetical protein [Komagataeibacter xylinus]|uniref:hypothetical protein n=1 Tax=Komagataeibacter xylinus TaxID=28448 RepID=UPI000FDF6ED2|nr:hypothetical protein [Komagataeibacter xylinus]AZV39947.1 hypothetical protein CXP35_15405 [Komagataeibacter xylinus]
MTDIFRPLTPRDLAARMTLVNQSVSQNLLHQFNRFMIDAEQAKAEGIPQACRHATAQADARWQDMESMLINAAPIDCTGGEIEASLFAQRRKAGKVRS